MNDNSVNFIKPEEPLIIVKPTDAMNYRAGDKRIRLK